MNTSQEGSSSAEPEAEAQPINLASKHASSPGRVLEQSKSIYLIKPTTTLGSGPVVTAVAGVPLTHTPPPAHTASGTSQQPVGPSVAIPMTMAVPITMTRLQTAVRPVTPLALAPRAVPAVASVPYSSLSVPVSQITTLHVPKGPAAVASLSVPRAAIGQPSSSSRPGTPAPAAPSSSAAPIALTKPMRPTIATVRHSGLIVGSPSSIAGAWLPVSANTLNMGTTQPAATPTSTAARQPASIPSKSNPSAIKPIPLPTPISVGGQARAPAPRSAIMTVNTRAPLSGTSPRAVSDIIRPGQAATVRPLVTLPSSTLIQVGDKQFTKSGSPAVSSTASSTSATSAGSRSIGILQQAPRPAASSSTAIQSSTGIASLPGRITVSTVVNATTTSQGTGQPLIFPGGLKSTTPSGPKVPLPQISVSTVSSKPFHVASTVATRPVAVASTAAPAALSSRPLIISGPPSATSVLPVAKVLPQPVLAAASGSVKAVDLSTGASSAAAAAPPSSGSAESHPPPMAAATAQLQPSSSAPNLPPGIYVQKSANAGSQGEKLTPAGSYGFPGATIYYETTERTSFHPFLPTSGTLIQQPTSMTSRSGGSTSSDLLLSVSSQANSLSAMQSVTSKVGSSPRPSILRKRDHDGTPLKAQRTLFSSITSTQVTSSTTTSIVAAASAVSSVSPPSELTMHGESSRSSTGSTTLSASSSPGIPADLEDSNPLPPPPIITSSASLIGKALSAIQVKLETSAGPSAPRLPPANATQGPPVEMSPRKKPRKQQLLGQELQEVRSSDEELRQQQLLLLSKPDVVKREPPPPPKEATEAAAVLKRPRASLMSSCKQTWKSRNNHFVRYSDVKLKDERRPTVTDLANQKQVMQKVNGWKVYHLSAQIEEMARLENEAHERLTTLLDLMESLGAAGGADRDLTRVHELIKGNLQRSKVIQDQLQESKSQVLKVFEHKPRVEEIIHRYMFKRLPKKREKS